MVKKRGFWLFGILVIFSIGILSASTTITDNSINTTGNITVGSKITLVLGEIIDNLIDGWIKITGGLNVTGNVVSQENITADYLIGDGSQLFNVNISSGNVVIVQTESDLPSASGGKIQLEENTVYFFKGFVTSVNTIVLANVSPLIGSHGSTDGFIHLGGKVAIQSNDYNNSGFFMRNLYVGSPGGWIFNLTASNTTEMLVESVAFSDAPGLGNIAKLGKITGYRVPTFKGVNFEDFDEGITFDGNPDKIFISSSPFRKVTASNVVILNFSSTLEVDIVDLVDNYFKALVPDTTVVNSGVVPENIFQYRGNTHDSSVNKSLILTGLVGKDKKGTKVLGSYPLADSSVGGIIRSTASKTITGSGSEFKKINVTTTISDLERVVMPENGTLQYDSRFDQENVVYTSVKVSGASTDDFRIRFVLNGDPTGRSETSGSLFNSNSYTTLTLVDKMELSEGDNITVEIKNNDTASDLTIEDFVIVI